MTTLVRLGTAAMPDRSVRRVRRAPARAFTSLTAIALASLAVVLVPLVQVASGQSSLVTELDAIATRYHENPSQLDRIRAGLEEAIKTDSHVDNLVALARVSFIWGDIRARTVEEKLEAYDRGRQVAKRALELTPKSVPAHFWFAINSGRWAQTKGVLRSLFLLPTLKEEIQIILDLDSKFTPVYALAGTLYYEVPGVFGGDLNLAEEMFRKGLGQDPRFAAMRVGLGKTLIKKGRIAEARRELQAVLDDKAPSNLADWTLRDSKEARALLESIRGKT
jgi:tetratricopeptide (TPR) repeat protein